MWWWLTDYLYAGWQQVRAPFVKVPSRYKTGDPTKPVILVIPGVYETWSFMQHLADGLNEAGYRIAVVRGLGYNVLPITETARRIARALARRETPRAGRIILAHSKGGLVGKQMMIARRSDLGIKGMVTICTPFSGSSYARFVLDPTLRTFSPRNKTILSLAAEASINAHIVSLAGLFDPQVPEGSVLEGGRNVSVHVPGHFRILGARKTLDAVTVAITGLHTQAASETELPGQ